MRKSSARIALALAALAGLGISACSVPDEASPRAATEPQEATIVVGATSFTPGSVTVEAGRPVRLHFQRTAEAACAEEVVFADVGIRRPLPPNQTTTVELPAQGQRTLTFACGVGMLQGKLLVQ
jgi:plastocyanin domain-containing protein